MIFQENIQPWAITKLKLLIIFTKAWKPELKFELLILSSDTSTKVLRHKLQV